MYVFIHIGHSRNSIQHKSTGINIAAWISSTILYLFKAVLQCHILSTLKQLMLDPGHLYFENKYFYNIFQFTLIMFVNFIHQKMFNVHLLVFFNPLPRSEEGIIRMHFVRLSVCLFVTYVCIDGLPSNFVQMFSLLRWCVYIQEYLGYRSNNLYFLISHSWPVVEDNFGQVQRTSQVERKPKCS